VAKLACLLALLALAAAAPAAAHLPAFEPASPWSEDVSGAPVDAQSAALIAWLASVGGFGFGRMQIDFSIEVLDADEQAPFLSFEPTGDFYSPDCDHEPVPVPPGGALEGESGYACEGDGDCHLIVWHRPSKRLFEMWRADLRGGDFLGGCLAVWDLARPYGPAGRGEQCTSADASGFPIAPLLFDADEVAAGEIRHAIRFILPNARIRHRSYVRPATHATGAASGGVDAPPYGTRLRLRADYPVESLPNPGARVVARALQRYGMLLADGGNVALTARSDRFTQHKWQGLLGPHDLRQVRITDFEMIEAGERFPWSGDCERTGPVPAAPGLFPH
jgi:serine/threonine-protein kinase